MAAIDKMKTFKYVQPTTPDNPVWRTAKKVTSTATELIVNFEPKDETGVSITDEFLIGIQTSAGYTETMLVTNVSGTTLTVVRGINLGGLDFVGDADFAVEHDAGETAVFNITANVLQMFASALTGEIGSGLKLSQANTFMEEGILADRIFADATARDAAITSPTNGMHCYNTATGVIQQYIGGAWADTASGTTVNASEIVAGKVELATDAEITAGTDVGGSGATVVVKPTQLQKSINLQSATLTSSEETDLYSFEDVTDSKNKKITKANLRDDLAASTTIKGTVELATDVEAAAGTDETKYINSKQLVTVGASKIQTLSQGASATITLTTTSKPKLIRVTLYSNSDISCVGTYNGTDYNCFYTNQTSETPSAAYMTATTTASILKGYWSDTNAAGTISQLNGTVSTYSETSVVIDVTWVGDEGPSSLTAFVEVI